MKKSLLLSVLILVSTFAFTQAKSVDMEIGNAGTLESKIPAGERDALMELTITGEMDARDFKFLRDELPALEELNIREVNIMAYEGEDGTYMDLWNGYAPGNYNYLANVFPYAAFLNGGANLKKVIFPLSLTTVDDVAFMYHTSLTEADFFACENLERIGYISFSYCASLKKVLLPASLTSFGGYSFEGLSEAEFTCYASDPSTMAGSFGLFGLEVIGDDYIDTKAISNCILYVPSASVDAYRAVEPWSNFGEIKAIPSGGDPIPTQIVEGATTIELTAANLAGRINVKLSGDEVTADQVILLNAASDMLTLDMTGINIIAEGLIPTNPNCLIYVDNNVTLSGNNIVKGNNAVTIVLNDQYAFNNVKEFIATTITYTRTFPIEGWASLCLPFIPDNLPGGVILQEFDSADGSVANFKAVTDITANTPYIANISGELEKTFTAQNEPIEITTMRNIAKGDFTFNGILTSINAPAAEGLYILTTNGDGFGKASNLAEITPFRAYMKYTGNGIAPVKGLSFGEGGNTTNLNKEFVKNDLTVDSANGIVEIYTTRSQAINIYATDGHLIYTTQLNEGRNVIDVLTPGIYLLNGNKLVVR